MLLNVPAASTSRKEMKRRNFAVVKPSCGGLRRTLSDSTRKVRSEIAKPSFRRCTLVDYDVLRSSRNRSSLAMQAWRKNRLKAGETTLKVSCERSACGTGNWSLDRGSTVGENEEERKGHATEGALLQCLAVCHVTHVRDHVRSRRTFRHQNTEAIARA